MLELEQKRVENEMMNFPKINKNLNDVIPGIRLKS
jgi:hypothetical protein